MASPEHPYASAHHNGDLISDTFVAQAGVHGSQGKLHGDTDVVPDHLGSGARPAAETVNGDDVCAGPGDSGSNGSDMVDRGNLDRYRLLVVGRLLEGVDELAQVLDGVDVVMRRRGDGVGAHGDHAGLGDLVVDLLPGEMAADPGLCPLTDLDLDPTPAFRYCSLTPKRPEATWTMTFLPYLYRSLCSPPSPVL